MLVFSLKEIDNYTKGIKGIDSLSPQVINMQLSMCPFRPSFVLIRSSMPHNMFQISRMTNKQGEKMNNVIALLYPGKMTSPYKIPFPILHNW